MRKLGQKAKLEDKEDVKVEKAAEHVEVDSKPKVFSAGITGKYSLFSEEKLQPRQQLIPAEVSKEVKAAVTEEVAALKEEFQTQQRSPLTILSDDEGYLLEEDQPVDKTEDKPEACREFSTSEIKTVKPNRKKKKKFEVIAPYCRPKTRPTNKLRWNMKKLLNPKLNSKQVTVLKDISSGEEPEFDTMNIKSKGKTVAKASSSHPAKVKGSSQ